MSTIRIKRKVKSTLLKIRELEKFKGKNVELEIRVKELKSLRKGKKNKSFAGIFSDFANRSLIDTEKAAWSLVVKDKHESYRR